MVSTRRGLFVLEGFQRGRVERILAGFELLDPDTPLLRIVLVFFVGHVELEVFDGAGDVARQGASQSATVSDIGNSGIFGVVRDRFFAGVYHVGGAPEQAAPPAEAIPGIGGYFERRIDGLRLFEGVEGFVNFTFAGQRASFLDERLGRNAPGGFLRLGIALIVERGSRIEGLRLGEQGRGLVDVTLTGQALCFFDAGFGGNAPGGFLRLGIALVVERGSRIEGLRLGEQGRGFFDVTLAGQTLCFFDDYPGGVFPRIL